jgi:eukaryotic-like serine/threonine-protein kinase
MAALQPGSRLGPYEITAFLGAGGMGEVYRARDTRLDRAVAVKVLPESVRRDPAALARFEREARAVGALSHPNIVAIFDVGHLRAEGASASQGDDVTYLVMELLEGETLRARLQRAQATPTPRPDTTTPAPAGTSASGSTRGGLPIKKTLDIAAQIAQGLAAAHAKGLVHRDLKPENVFLTTDGRVKVLDFGLARALAPDTASASTRAVDVAAVAASPDTQPGTVLGTVGYMAPEQVRGQAADPRADIFALGAVLFEMLTGERAFTGASAIETMSAILRVDPLERLEGATGLPANLAAIVRHCLEKEPDERFQSARDLAFQLQAAAGVTIASGQVAALPPKRSRRMALAVVAGVVLVAGSAAGTLVLSRRFAPPAPAPPPVTFTIAPPEGADFGGAEGLGVSPQISPDGQQLAFSAATPGARGLWVRPLKGLAARQYVAGTAGSASPLCWSPDSRSIAFMEGTFNAKRLDLDSGITRTLCEKCLNGRTGCAWAPDGTIVLGNVGETGLRRLPATGGAPTPVTTLDAALKETRHMTPSLLPDGRHFVYRSMPEGVIWAGSLDGGKAVRLMPSDSGAVYAPPGYLLFVRQRMLYAQRFDADRLALGGDPIPVAENVRTVTAMSWAAFTVSSTGVLVYRTGTPLAATGRQLVWLDRATGRESGVVKESDANYEGFKLLPDERSVVAAISGEETSAGKNNVDLWRIDLDSGARTRLTFDPGADRSPVVSPDGAWVAWASDRLDPAKLGDIFRKPSNGAGADERWIAPGMGAMPSQWSANWLVFNAYPKGASSDLWVAPVADPAKASPYLQEAFGETGGQLSPDEQWMAYTSRETGKSAVYIRPFPNKRADKWLISGTDVASMLQWGAGGKELFYQSGDRIMAVAMTLGGRSITHGQPREVVRYAGGPIAITRDGRRFLALSAPPPAPSGPSDPLTVVVNWLGLVAPATVK